MWVSWTTETLTISSSDSMSTSMTGLRHWYLVFEGVSWHCGGWLCCCVGVCCARCGWYKGMQVRICVFKFSSSCRISSSISTSNWTSWGTNIPNLAPRRATSRMHSTTLLSFFRSTRSSDSNRRVSGISRVLRHHEMKMETLSLAWKVPGWGGRSKNDSGKRFRTAGNAGRSCG